MEEYLYSIDRVEQTLHIENVTLTVFSHVGIFQTESSENTKLRQMLFHEHAHWEMFGGMSGQLEVNFSDCSCVLNAGDVIIIHPHVPHNTNLLETDVRWDDLWFHYVRNTNTCAHDLYRPMKTFLGEQPYILIRDRPDICRLIHQAAEEGLNHATLHACMLTTEIFFQFLRPVLEEKRDAYQILENSAIGRLEKLDQILNDCFLRPLPLHYVAEKLFISERQLERIVKKRYGVPYREIVLEKRIQAAKQLLTKSEQSLQEIAYMIGFHSKESFCAAFRRKVGVTPNKYRETQKTFCT